MSWILTGEEKYIYDGRGYFILEKWKDAVIKIKMVKKLSTKSTGALHRPKELLQGGQYEAKKSEYINHTHKQK